jgi:hypothetical protein
MCAHVGNQQSHGVLIARLRSSVQKPSSPTSSSPPIDLPLPHRRSRTNLSSSGIRAVSDFRLPVRYYRVSFSLVVVFHT